MLTNLKKSCIFDLKVNFSLDFGVEMRNEKDTIKNVTEKEYRASVSNLSLALFLYGHTAVTVGSQTQPEETLNMHVHSYMEMFCCSSDGASVMTPDGVIKLSRGDVAIIPISYPHFAFGNFCALTSLGFMGRCTGVKSDYDFYADFSDLFEINKPRIYRGASEIYDRIIALKKGKHEPFSPMPALEFLLVLKMLLKYDYVHLSSDAEWVGKMRGKEQDIARFLLLEELISTHFLEEYDADETAKRLCITRRHMDRIVKEHYGEPLRELIYKKRIMYAKRLLCESNETVEKIATLTGFSGRAAFKNAFFSLTGQTPSEYRIQNRSK